MAINIKFPIIDNKVDNFLFKGNVITRDALRSKLALLINTKKRQRYYLPIYGLDLDSLLFEQKDSVTFSLVENEIKRTVSLFIPELTITKVDFYEITDKDGNVLPENQLEMEVYFTYNDNIFENEDFITVTI